MAYPLAPALSYADFKVRLEKEFDCKLVKLDGKLIDPQGAGHTVHYFERKIGTKVLRSAAPDLSDDTILLFSVMRSVCAKLDIPAEAFGLDLGWVN